MSKLKIGALTIAVALVITWGCAGLIKRRAKLPQIKDAQYAGTQSCIEQNCHPQRMQDIVDSVHGKLFEPDKPACELCHGKGSLHIASTTDPELILSYKRMAPQQQSEVCLTCHATGALDKWYNSGHYQKGVSCNECHLSHATSDKQALRADDPQICYKCHSEVKQRFTLASTHQFKDQEFRCSLCHKSHEKHDTLGKENVRRTVCLGCHKKYGAAFEYKHEPVAEDCLECHLAHGSEYPELGNADIRTMCEACHSYPAHQLFLIARSFTDAERKLKAGKCVTCHKNLHGSKYQGLLNRQPPRMGPPTGFTPPGAGAGGIGGRSIEMQPEVQPQVQPQEEGW